MKKARKSGDDKKLYYHVKPSTDLSSFPEIKGPDFSKKVTLSGLLKSFSSMGLQASDLGHAIHIANTMIREKVSIYLSFTSNMISSGVREIITYLVREKKVAVLSTAAGGVEEDVIKAFSDFRLGTFHASGGSLFEAGVGRIGNIYATNEQYSYLEIFMRKVFDALLVDQKKTGVGSSPSDLVWKIGELLCDEDCDYKSSYVYWAYKNNIPVYCPGIVDGAIGDYLYFYKNTHPEFVLDPVIDHKRIIDYTLQQEKTGGIVLGGGISKHYILNANIFKEGFDYSIYISTAQPYDGSDSGGNQEEAVTWAKIKVHAPRVKVYCDASIAFPLLVAGSFGK
jgi:deoxyhypusine synthase